MKKFNLFCISQARDVLFGIATLWIVLFHSSLDFSWFLNCGAGSFGKLMYHAFRAVKYIGDAGVDIFLFLSGVGLYFSFSKDENIGRFYKKRALRILPPSLIVAIIWYAVNFESLPKFVYSVLFLEAFIDGQWWFWFISLILLLYLAYPMVYKIYDKYGLKAFIASLLLVLALNFAMERYLNTFYGNVEIMFTRIPAFLIGAYAASFVKEKKKIPMYIIYICPVVFLCAWALVYSHDLGGVFMSKTLYRYLLSIIGLSLIPVISAVKQGSHRPWKLLTWVGGYSIEIYLVFEKINMKFADIIPTIDSFNIFYNAVTFGITLILSLALKYICSLISEAIQNPHNSEKIHA